jgi:TRAP-type C4-dicarboxylate transport system substrate-binding protein
MHPRTPLLCLPALAVVALVTASGKPRDAVAQDAAISLRIATVTPRGSVWHRVLTAWGNSLRTATGGRLTIQVQSAGAGDERNLVRSLRARQIDGASLTAIGLGEIAQPILVLQAPGVAESYEGLDRTRTAMDGELRRLLEQNGVVHLGWSDYGRARIFSTRPVARPSDLRQALPWVMPDDPMFPELLRVVGATGVPAPIGDVMGALHAGRIDTVVASATAVTVLQWHTRLTHVTQQSYAVLIGGTVISRERYEALPPDLQQALRDTARQAHETLQRMVRRDDDRYHEMLIQRGTTPVDASAHEAEWRQVAQQARERLVGRLFSRELLERALSAGR